MHDIKYAEIVFKLRFLENTSLPKYKTSMLNGALLNILSNLYCINEKKCCECNIVSRCIIQKLLGGKYEAQLPLILQDNRTYPYYVINCEDERTHFPQDQELIFSVKLAGYAIDYISQFIYAFDLLGNIGLGKKKANYDLIGVYNNKSSPIFENGILYEANICIQFISDYISQRKASIHENISLEFITPYIPEKSHHNNRFDYSVENVCFSIRDRLNSLGIIKNEDEKILAQFQDSFKAHSLFLNIVKTNYPTKETNQNEIIIGLKGKVGLSSEIYKFIDLILACENFSIGNHILLGYGKFTIKEER